MVEESIVILKGLDNNIDEEALSIGKREETSYKNSFGETF